MKGGDDADVEKFFKDVNNTNAQNSNDNDTTNDDNVDDTTIGSLEDAHAQLEKINEEAKIGLEEIRKEDTEDCIKRLQNQGYTVNKQSNQPKSLWSRLTGNKA
jgi:hypothetical protein